MSVNKTINVFIQGAISPEKIAASIASHQAKTNIGGHSIFLGQVRSDVVDNKTVRSIAYTAYEEMANEVIHTIRESAFRKFSLNCLHVYHSLGEINAGELCLFVFTSSKHRKEAIEACNYVVEEIKAKAPIFGREIFEDKSFKWKVNQ